MAIAIGDECYKQGISPCSGVGLIWTEMELDDAISGPVASVVFDDSGKADVAALLASVAETEFAKDQLARVLARTENLEDWRVGEAIAETYLTDHRNWTDSQAKCNALYCAICVST